MPVMPNGNALPGGGEQADQHGHVIVCGLPGVGLRIVEQLTLSGVPAVVVDEAPGPALARAIAVWGVPLVTGSTRAEETLMSAGLASAIAVICAQHNDLAALETALLTRRLRGDVRVVVQLGNPAVGPRSRRSASRSSTSRVCRRRRWWRRACARGCRS